MKTNRRQFIGSVGALAASTFPMPAFAQAKPKVVVIGGGPGGATAAKYIAKDGGLDVSLVEPARRFTTCFHSNLYLGGFKSWESITHSYDKIAKAYGIDGVKISAAAEFKPALERAIKANRPCVIDVVMQNEPVPTAGHWNIMDIYSPGKKVHHASTAPVTAK